MRITASLILFVLTLTSLSSYAGKPVWTFTPLTATNLSLTTNDTATVQYLITNKSARSHNLAMTGMTGVSQITNGAGICRNPFLLTGNSSCVLSLQINGGQAQAGNTNGPVVCEQGSALQCYRPGSNDTLNITLANAKFTVSGTVSGLVNPIQLQNNGTDLITVNANGSFTFPTPLATGASYNITVATQPTSQICGITNGSGTIGSTAINNVSVQCNSFAYLTGGLTPTVIYRCPIDLNAGGAVGTCADSGATGQTYPAGIALNKTKNFAYIPNLYGNSINQCAINPNTGALNSCRDSGATALNGPFAIVFSQSGQSVYVSNFLDSTVVKCNVNPINGLLSSCANAVSTNFPAINMVFNNAGTILYITHQAQTIISSCDVNPITGIVSNCSNSGATNLTEALGVAVNSAGTLVYVTDGHSNNVKICPVTTGKNLGPCVNTGGPFSIPRGIVLNADESLAYIVNNLTTGVSKCTVMLDGSLTNCVFYSGGLDPLLLLQYMAIT